MDVRIDETRNNYAVRKIDNAGAGRYRNIGSSASRLDDSISYDEAAGSEPFKRGQQQSPVEYRDAIRHGVDAGRPMSRTSGL